MTGSGWRRRLPLATVVVLAAVFFAALFVTDSSRVPDVPEGRGVPPFTLSGPTPGDPGLSRSDLVTGRFVLLNVWASWCRPCRQEHPLLMRLAREGVAVFGVAYKDASADVRRFLGSLGTPYRRVGLDRHGDVAVDLGVYGIPETFVVDGSGAIVMRHAGPLTPEALEDYAGLLRAAASPRSERPSPAASP